MARRGRLRSGRLNIRDAVLVLGEDIPNVAPRMALALRQSVRQQTMQLADKLRIPRWLDQAVREAVHGARGPLYSAFPAPTRLDEFATETLRAAPDDIARLGFAVAHALDPGEAEVEGLSENTAKLAERIAAALQGASRPVVIAGPSLRSEAVIRAAASVARALVQGGNSSTGLSYVVPECNTVGLALFGAAPLEKAFDAAPQTAIVLENDLYRRAPSAKVDSFLKSAKHVVALDHLSNSTTDKAELLLPASTFAEGDGTLVSNEGRAQRFFQVYVPNGDILESWRWLGQGSWTTLDDVIQEMCATVPDIAAAREASPPAVFREAGQKVPRQPHRFSGRTAMYAHLNVSEPKPPEDPDSPLSFSMEGYPDQPPPSLIPFFWSPGWNSIQSLNRFQEEIAGPLRGGNPGVRLIEPGQDGALSSGSIPPAFRARQNEWLVIPLHHVFGSEELSAAAPALTQLAPAPYIALSPEDAKRLGAEAGQELELLGGRQMPLTILPGLPRGVAGWAQGLAGTRPAELPAWSPIIKKP